MTQTHASQDIDIRALATQSGRLDRDAVAVALGIDRDDVSQFMSLEDLAEGMGDATVADGRAMVDLLADRNLIEWISDTDGGLCWASDEQWHDALAVVCQ